MWSNPGEVPGNGVDDDNNGWIDDIHGIDLCHNDGDPDDEDSHGTHCAGTIAAKANNGIGVAGVASYVPNVQILGIKFLDGEGSGYISDVVAAIDYTVDKG
jgi:subtilisin family serine protease